MPCVEGSLLEVLENESFIFNLWISFFVEVLMIFDSAPESIKINISRSGC